MITGTLMYDITIEADGEKELEVLGQKIREALGQVQGVKGSEEVDSDVIDDSETD